MNEHSPYEIVIGLEVHAALETASKMFCSCPVVDSTHDLPNHAVCPVCAGMPGVLPVVNQKAVEYAIRVALALDCEIAEKSVFARKSYFYPDLPKGYQISQYEQPLAQNGKLIIETSQGEKEVRIRRVHLEEDTGKLVHKRKDGEQYSLVNLNRSGVPLLEIVTEPDMNSVEEARAYVVALRSLLRYLKVNSGDFEKGVIRMEPNISLRPKGSEQLGTRTEIKNLNSIRSLERGLKFEVARQSQRLTRGEKVRQETMGWNEEQQSTVPQRSKEDAEDYRYFPEPDLPPLIVSPEWIEEVKAGLPELPYEKYKRFQVAYGLSAQQAQKLVADQAVAEYYERVVQGDECLNIVSANWILGELFGYMNDQNIGLDKIRTKPEQFAELMKLVIEGDVNQPSAKRILSQSLKTGEHPNTLMQTLGLKQVSDETQIAAFVARVLDENPKEVAAYLAGKQNIAQYLVGQVMRLAGGKANPQVVQRLIEEGLQHLKKRI